MPDAGALLVPSSFSSPRISPDLAEQNTGLRWFDGNLIFEKTVIIPALPWITWAATGYPHGIANIGVITRISGMAYRNDGGHLVPLPRPASDASIALHADRSNIFIQPGFDYSNYHGWVTLRYTRTFSYLLTHTVGAWQNASTGTVGIWFAVARPITITSVGRLFNPLDTTTDTVMQFGYMVPPFTGVPVVTGQATIPHGTGAFMRWVWTDIATPWLAEPGTNYTIRYDRPVDNRFANTTNVTVPGDFAAFGRSSQAFLLDPTPNAAWGPIDFRYYVR